MNSDDIGIQCNIISSTSDIYSYPFNSHFSFRGRSSYRKSFRKFRPLFRNPRTPSPIYRRSNSLRNFILEKIRIIDKKISTKWAVISVILIFLSSLFALFLVYRTFPNITLEERKHFKIPWDIEDAKQLGLVLNRYKADHYYQVMAGVFTVYIFLQTFAIPGSLFLSILSGYLFPFFVALVLVCTCSMVGATLCFLLSQLLGRKLVLHFFPERAAKWSKQVNHHRENLFNYIVFLRVTPFLPNWFINLTAPVIGVPLYPFAFGTFVGVAPPSFIAIQGGKTLHDMTSKDSAFNLTTFAMLAVCGLISLVPILLKNRVREKIE